MPEGTPRDRPAAAAAPAVQRADPAARRRALVLGIAAVLAAAGALLALPPWLEGYVAGLLEAPPAARVRAIRTLALGGAAALGLPVLGLGLYLLRQARRVLESGRHPPPAARVLVDTPILTGPAALRHARRIRRMGQVCVLTAPALAIWSYVRLTALARLLGG